MLELLLAGEADVARIAAIERGAITPDATNAVLFPGPFDESDKSREDALMGYIRSSSACRCVKIVDRDLEAAGEEAIIAFSLWYFWDTQVPTLPRPTWGSGTNAEACDLYFGALWKFWNTTFGGKQHALLKFMHTDPAHQRRGAGSMMLEWGLTEADRLELPSYLESSAEGLRLYERFGFKVTQMLDADLSKWGGPVRNEVPVMVRDARRI